MMNKLSVKLIFLAMIGALIVSGCAKPHAGDEMTSDAPSTEMAVSAPQTAPADLPATDMQPVQVPDVKIVLDKVYFAYDQSTLSEQTLDILAVNATSLQTAPELKITIEGHCDNRGSDEYNLALGERRAQSVRDYLVSLGIAPERLVTISYGEEMPAEMTNNQLAWAKNRRVEFKMLN